MTTINSEITKILKDFKIRQEEGLCYLLCIYYCLDQIPEFIPEVLKSKIIATNIFSFDKGVLTWNVSLFEKQNTHFEWVEKEYIPLFTKIGKLPHVTECMVRMQQLFASHPDIRKEEVLEATKQYISTTEVSYVRQPHYFIWKGTGKEKTYDLYQYILLLRERVKSTNTVSTFIGNKMQ